MGSRSGGELGRFVSRLRTALFSKPGLNLLYGPPGSYKTTLLLGSMAGLRGFRRVYVASGKHRLYEYPRWLTVYLSGDIFANFAITLALYQMAPREAEPLAVAYDTLVADYAAARAFLRWRAVAKVMATVLAVLRDLADEYSARVVVVSLPRVRSGVPVFWGLISRFVDGAVSLSVEGERLIARFKDHELNVVAEDSVGVETLLDEVPGGPLEWAMRERGCEGAPGLRPSGADTEGDGSKGGQGPGR